MDRLRPRRILLHAARAAASYLLLAGCANGDAVERAPELGRAAEAGEGIAPQPESARPVARGVTGYYDLGDYFVLGEVANDSDTPIYGVELEIDYLDAEGKVLGTDPGGLPVSRVEPRGAAPFVDTRYGAPAGIERAVVRVSRWSAESGVDYRPLTVLGTTAREGITGVIVAGEARNDSGRPLSSIKLVTSFRDAEGNVVGIFFDYPVTGAVQAGETFPFTVETFDSTMAGHAVLVQGEGRGGG